MKRNSWALMAAFAMGISMLSGCQSEEKPKEKVEEKQEKEEKTPAKVLIDYFVEDGDIDEDDCTYVINPRFYNSEYLTPIVITTDKTIYDIQLLDVEMGTIDGEDTYYFVNDVIFKKQKLTKNEPILIDTEFTEFTPNLLFAYTDAEGTEKKVSISMSGKDSSIVISPALLETGEKPMDYYNSEDTGEVRQYGEDVPIGPLE